MAKKPKDVFEHLRREVPGPKGSALEKRIYERRGARQLAIEIFKHPGLTFAAAVVKGDAGDKYSLLFNGAHHWLKEANEVDFFQAAAIATEAAKDAPQNGPAVESLSLAIWASQVGQRNGYLSPAAIAAYFLFISDHLHRMVDGNEELLNAIYAFADAWHWAHFEGTGEHELAAIGVASETARAKGPETKKRDRAQKEKITKDALQAYKADLGGQKLHPKAAAGALLNGINEILVGLKLHTYSQTSLEKAIRAILRNT